MTTPGPVRRWVLAARPRTLPAAAVPVVVAGALAIHHTRPLEWALSLVVALSLQVGTNYANDYSDGVRGTDEVRVGPFRLTASRLVPATRVRRAAFLSFTVAAIAGVELAALVSWWYVPLGVSAVLAGWFYTGGPHPYGYVGLGELFVMIYFGLVATLGTYYAEVHALTARSWWLGVAAGAMAVAMLEANNLRDVSGDQLAGKKTLAARLGRRRATWLYVGSVLLLLGGLVGTGEWLAAVVALVAYAPALRLAASPNEGRALLPLLKDSARAQLVVGLVVAVLLAL